MAAGFWIRACLGAGLAGGVACLSGAAAAARLTVLVDDGSAPVADAVVSLHAAPGNAAAGTEAVMDQRDTAFVPGVLPIQVGTAVRFPNSDSVRHQVYSFSPAQPFELPLYAGTPLDPVRFERPGVVVVGCNIHDWMIGWIVVLDTPWFARSDAAGKVVLDVPDGAWELRVWHARMKGQAPAQAVALAGSSERRIGLVLAPPPPDRRGSDRLRQLQERLRNQRGQD